MTMNYAIERDDYSPTSLIYGHLVNYYVSELGIDK